MAARDDERERGFHWRREETPGFSFTHARFVSSGFPRHTHEGFGVCVIEEGAHRLTARGTVWTVSSARIAALNPDEPHDGCSADPGRGFTFRSLYIDADAVPFDDTTDPGLRARFVAPVVDDPELATALSRVHRLCEPGAGADALRVDTLLTRTAATLFRRHARGFAPPAPGREAARVARARAWLLDNLDRNVGLTELAAIVGIGPFRLVRAFETETGLPPHAWLVQARVARARDLLRRGVPPAEVAVTVGFHDQSHLTRRFHALTGVTPARFAAAEGRGGRSARTCKTGLTPRA